MADKLNKGNIWTSNVGNNLIVVDPNKIVGSDGGPQDRLVNTEDMVMYANLEARIFPRSKVIAGLTAGDRVSVGIFDGELNFLKPRNSDFINSDWTEAFTDPGVNQKVIDKDGIKIENGVDFQGFGITSINVILNSSYIPQVTINFTDIRGKTLFEQARGNTPYTAFFHLPYPTFFLTLKGYYGKAVRYQLTMESFTSRFDPTSGDYLVTCIFKGNHIAMLRDIVLHQALTAPYMYPIKQNSDGDITETKGRQKLREVYKIYKEKELIPSTLPELTMVELIEKLKILENDMGRLYGEADLTMTTDKLEYESALNDLRVDILGSKGWVNTYLDKSKGVKLDIDAPDRDPTNTTGRTVSTTVYPIIGIDTFPTGSTPSDITKFQDEIKEKAETALAAIINTFRDEVKKNKTFGPNGKEYGIRSKLVINLLLKTLENSTVYKGISYEGDVTLDSNLTPWIMVSDHEKTIMGNWMKTKELFDGPDGMAKKMAKEVSERLNTKMEGVIGFKPTIRNIFAILMAGADTFLRLLDDVHKKAMSVSDNELRKKTSDDSSVEGMVFPWPQYHRVEEEDECTTSSIVTYPGAKGAITETGATDKEVWPEVEFVEEYAMSSIYKSTKFNLDNNNEVKSFTPTSVKDWGVLLPAFDSVDYVELLWELISRAQNAIRYGGLYTRFKGASSNSANVGSVHMELSKYDSENLQERINDFEGMKELFSDIKTKQQVLEVLSSSDPDNYVVFQKDGLGRPMTQTTFKWASIDSITPVKTKDFKISNKGLMAEKNSAGIFDLVPTIMGYPSVASNDWVKNNYANGDNILSSDFYNIGKGLAYETSDTNIVRDTDIVYVTKNWAPEQPFAIVYRGSSEPNISDNSDEHYATCLENTLITEGVIKVPPTTTPPVGNAPPTVTQNQDKVISMLNTPYFINSLITGANNEIAGVTEAYKEVAYLFLNSLPLPTFREKCRIVVDKELEFGDYISQMFNQVGAIHDIPVSLALKIGSLWWRYKSNITTPGSDVLNTVWSDVTPTNIYGSALATNYTYTTDSGSVLNYKSELSNTMMVGVYPSLINTIHYIVSGTQPPLPPANTNLTTGLFASQTQIKKSPITINDNGVEVQLFTVFVNSVDILTPTLQAKKNGTPITGNYHILYPSSGALAGTDITSNGPVTMGDVGIHNGATRLIWGLSNYGYFKNKASYKPPTNSYIKKVDTTKEEQFDWGLNETSYSTINELRGVFNNEQLEFFESLFLKFTTPSGGAELGGSMKNLIKEFIVVEKEWTENISAIGPGSEGVLRIAQLQKFILTIEKFLNREILYVHESTTGLDLVKGSSSLLQKVKALIDNDSSYNFGEYLDVGSTDITTITTASPEYKSMCLHVGDYDVVGSSELSILTGVGGTTNPMYNFFPTMSPNGLACTTTNIEEFAPLIRLYVSHCIKNSVITAEEFVETIIKPLINDIEVSEANYINNVLGNLTTDASDKGDPDLETDMSDSRSKVTSDDLKLELYNQFKVINDRWVSGLSLENETLFDRFLFFDRANRDIGDKAYVNIWDILQIGSPFDSNGGASLKQGISSFVSTILANNFFNFIPLPAYINFYNVGNDNTQVQGNTLFGTHRQVDYVESSPAFLCQYIGKPSEQVNSKTTNNGFKDDASSINNPEKNILLGGDCGDRKKSSKVVGFNVDFGIENQNIFESVTLDQSQYQNTSESYAILQQMADSGGPGATSMASSSLYNIYNSRSYTAKVTCMGNMMIQPTQYFQLRYLPMFNGPYLIINVNHNITPNSIETSFEGVRVPIPKLPTISDITARVNEKLFLEAEKRVKDKRIAMGYDPNDITPKQSKLTPEDNNYVDLEFIPTEDDGIEFTNPIEPHLVDAVEFDIKKPHLGLDLKPKVDQIDESLDRGLSIKPILHGRVLHKLNGCGPQQTTNNCGTYGNFVRTKLDINGNTGSTVYYKVLYGNLRTGSINVGETVTVFEAFYDTEDIGIMGNSGVSSGTHLHLEVRRGVKNSSGNVVEHILNPRNLLPMFIDNN